MSQSAFGETEDNPQYQDQTDFPELTWISWADGRLHSGFQRVLRVTRDSLKMIRSIRLVSIEVFSDLLARCSDEQDIPSRFGYITA